SSSVFIYDSCRNDQGHGQGRVHGRSRTPRSSLKRLHAQRSSSGLVLIHGGRKSRIVAAISAAWVSNAKCPVSKKRTTAPGISRLNASAPAGRKNGSFLPHTASNGGRWVRK